MVIRLLKETRQALAPSYRHSKARQRVARELDRIADLARTQHEQDVQERLSATPTEPIIKTAPSQ